jgi:phosphoribosylamine--glycine ligase
MRVLVVGSGGREHALCWKLRQSPLLEDLYCAPGNPGIDTVADLVPIPADEIKKLADFAADLKIDLTVVGPELPLTLGIADEFVARDLLVFGPRQQAAELEGSKVFAKEFLQRQGIPTAGFDVVHERSEAEAAARRRGFPVVLKADGLAAGKGVLIPRNSEELDQALEIFFTERRFGASGDRLIVEQHLEGEEVSFIALSDGRGLLPLATSKDYKRLLDNDQGPNTGGMGSHSPSVVLSGEEAGEILERIMHSVIAGMAAENRPFQGFLYAGLMLTPEGPQVLEFNVRLGDPEAQSVLLRLESDLLPVLAEGAAGQFVTQRLSFLKEAAVCVVLAAAGYPDKPVKGDPIGGLETAARREGVEVFHAGTGIEEGKVVTAGGRVLNVCARAAQLREALRRAYEAASDIHCPGMQFRKDIGRRVLTSASGGEG